MQTDRKDGTGITNLGGDLEMRRELLEVKFLFIRKLKFLLVSTLLRAIWRSMNFLHFYINYKRVSILQITTSK